jgi:large subunit ribosomal protein L10
MVSEKKKKTLNELKVRIKDFPVIGIINMHKLPGRQLHEIRNKLRGEAVILMVKKRLITKALKESGALGVEELVNYVQGEPALLLSKTDPFRLARKIEKSKSKAAAKPGDIAPEEIIIKAGPTSLPPGPVIGELQKIKLPAGVQGDKIHIMKDTVVAKEGDELSKDVTDVLAKLSIEPMEIGLTVTAAWESGVVYPKEILFVPLEEYENQVKTAGSAAFNLSININLPTPQTIPFLIAKASQEARTLAESANIITPDTIGSVLAKANAQADVVAGMVKPVASEKKEEASEAASEKTKPEEKKDNDQDQQKDQKKEE